MPIRTCNHIVHSGGDENWSFPSEISLCISELISPLSQYFTKYIVLQTSLLFAKYDEVVYYNLDEK